MGSPNKIDDEQFKQLLMEKKTMAEIAKIFGCSERRLYIRKSHLTRSGWAPEHGLTTQYDLGFMLGKVTIQRDAEGNVERTWERMVQDNDKFSQLLAESMQAMVEDLPRFKPVPATPGAAADLMTVIPLGDPHIGMLSWGEETGQDWDLKIAERYFCKAFSEIVMSAPRSKECVILNLGDFFHSDNMEGLTSRSKHALDMDSRYGKMIRIGVKIIRQMIESGLRHHDVVRVVNCIGNHDDIGSQWLNVLLHHAYENEPRVIIDRTVGPFNYVVWGDVLWGAHHGHSCKASQLAGVMACDMAKEWGKAKWRYWYTGHIHNDSAKEFPGVKWESFRTLAAKDAYATWGGYRAGQDIKAIVLHRKRGEIARFQFNIQHLKEATGYYL